MAPSVLSGLAKIQKERDTWSTPSCRGSAHPAGGMILGASNAALGGGNQKQVLQGAVIGGMSGLMGGAMGQWATSSLASPMISGLKIGSPILAGAINGAVGGAVGGAAGGFVGGLAVTGNPDQAMQMALQGALMGAGIGAAVGTVNGIKYARDNGLNPWTGAKNVPALRVAYVKDVERLSSIASKMRAEGSSSEEIARTLHGLRRELGIKYKSLTPDDMLQQIYERNVQKYGDKLGPTVEYLRQQGKSWDYIINSATRTGGSDLGF